MRNELGYPIMITPFAQFVGTQAVLNVVQGERYRHRAGRGEEYALGYFGKLLAPVDPDVLDRIVANGSPKIALKPRAACAGRRQAAQAISEHERRRASAALHVRRRAGRRDARLPAPMTTEYVFEKPIVRLVRELSERRLSRVHFSVNP